MGSRYDMYNNVHKGLRRALCGLLSEAGAATDLAELGARWAELETKLHAHHEHEDVFIGPHLARVAPSLFAQMEREHHVIAGELKAVRATSQGEDSKAFYRQLARFTSLYLAHMAEEEGAFSDALFAAYTDRDLRAIEHDLVSSIAPEALASMMAIMLPAMNLDERYELLAGMRHGAPPEVFAGMCQLAASVLEPSAWAALNGKLSAASAA